VRTLTHKLVFRFDPTDTDHDSELYDLVHDPRELMNIYGDRNQTVQAVQEALKEKLFMWMMMTSDVTPWVEDPRRGGWSGDPNVHRNNAHSTAAYFSDVGRRTTPRGVHRVWHE
jgi:hypothetical protein